MRWRALVAALGAVQSITRSLKRDEEGRRKGANNWQNHERMWESSCCNKKACFDGPTSYDLTRYGAPIILLLARLSPILWIKLPPFHFKMSLAPYGSSKLFSIVREFQRNGTMNPWKSFLSKRTRFIYGDVTLATFCEKEKRSNRVYYPAL